MAQSTSSWKVQTPKGEFYVSTYIGIGDTTGWVSVTITDPDGRSYEYRGRAEIERVSGVRSRGYGFSETVQVIKSVTIRGEANDVEASGKNAKQAVEAYGSELAQRVVASYTPSEEKAELITITMPRKQWEAVDSALYQLTWRGDGSERAVKAKQVVGDALR